MKTGNLSVHTENIFPIIKKFLYSDHEIFLRELVANAVDASQKLKALSSTGEFDKDLGELTITVSLDKDKGTLTVSDRGIGLTEEEVEKYINQIAFSGAEEFVQKYADKMDGQAIIGHFGLGFYSAFMVADKVELISKSFKENPAVKWTCTGTTTFEIEETTKAERGTDITLYINEDFREFLEESRIESLLKKYCRFLPIPVFFNGNQVNNTSPLWLRKPSELTTDDYISFYNELYPYSEKPHFWIHLNVDYPFNLTGILYFPRTNNIAEAQKNKIHLYSNQVFVTDKVDDIVPEFLTLLHGAIDSPDIPLNVSRSYLQSDSNVKKISSYIVKKAGEKLNEIFKDRRSEFEEKWDEVGFFIKYGMLADEKFQQKAMEFCLVQNTGDKYFTLAEYEQKITNAQTDKNGQKVFLYATQPERQQTFIDAALRREYDVLKFENPIDIHFVQLLESKLEKVSFKRVDSESIDKLIEKDVTSESVLSKKEQKKLEKIFMDILNKEQYQVQLQALSPDDAPLILTQGEFMRRMKDMSKMGGYAMNDFPMTYTAILNTNHPMTKKVLEKSEPDQQEAVARHLFDLARLSQNTISGKELSDFISRSLSFLA
ncbi:MAG: molecular chaperone HtpG [Bacteroidota bacterium]|nr:molecular chaperone HtpG [Bacteroidota bacterium]